MAGGGLAGGRSSGAAPLACGWPLRFFLLEGDARYAALAPASRPALRAPQRRWVPALTPAPFAWVARRKQENQKLQRPAAYRPGERRASFSPPPLRRPWEAQPPLRVAAAHSPQKNTSEGHCFFRFVALRARREVRMKLIMPGRLRTRSIAGLFPQPPSEPDVTLIASSGSPVSCVSATLAYCGGCLHDMFYIPPWFCVCGLSWFSSRAAFPVYPVCSGLVAFGYGAYALFPWLHRLRTYHCIIYRLSLIVC